MMENKNVQLLFAITAVVCLLGAAPVDVKADDTDGTERASNPKYCIARCTDVCPTPLPPLQPCIKACGSGKSKENCDRCIAKQLGVDCHRCIKECVKRKEAGL